MVLYCAVNNPFLCRPAMRPAQRFGILPFIIAIPSGKTLKIKRFVGRL
jgi:hypothetical protein